MSISIKISPIVLLLFGMEVMGCTDNQEDYQNITEGLSQKKEKLKKLIEVVKRWCTDFKESCFPEDLSSCIREYNDQLTKLDKAMDDVGGAHFVSQGRVCIQYQKRITEKFNTYSMNSDYIDTWCSGFDAIELLIGQIIAGQKLRGRSSVSRS